MADADPSQQPNPPPQSSGDPVADRRKKLAKLRDEFKVDPYGHRIDGLISLADARSRYNKEADDATKVPTPKDAPAGSTSPDNRPFAHVAGRVVLHRDIGKLVFLTIRDQSGDIQVGVSKKSVDDKSFQLAKLADLGDIVTAHGRLGTTKTGEITVWAEGTPPSPFSIASKSLAPPPEKYHGLTDPELRYRKRYVDLYANPEVMKLAQLRIRIVDEVRQFLRGRGFHEVETPMMQTLAGGAAARPFITHHNALDIDLFLRIAPELYLKRLLVGGFTKVFEVNRNFRNEGISYRHNPEFTMLEAYEAFGSWETMADMVEEMICTIAQNVFGTLVIEHKDAEGRVTKTINLKRPWRRVSMAELVEERTGWRFDKYCLRFNTPECGVIFEQMQKRMFPKNINDFVPFTEAHNRRTHPFVMFWDHFIKLSPAEQLVEVYERLIEPTLIDPCFVTHVPSVIIPLAKENKDDPFFADVYELAINGQEISPGYTELNDPDTQEKHFRHQVGDAAEQQKVDEDFLEALRVGMPPAGGMGLGIDRLVMMLTGAESIRDVILFPLMRPRI